MNAAYNFAPIEATTGNPIPLAMQRLWLTGQILPAGARLVVQHHFRSEEERPLEVIYSFMLPRDAALRSFRITGEGFEVHSELQETAEAVKTYERGIADGSLAAMARVYADGMVNLTVGNIRPRETVTVYLELLAGVELRDDGLRFRFPFTVAPAYHSQMRVATVDGEGELELPQEEFGDLILPRFRKSSSALHSVGFELELPPQMPVARIASPSHSIGVSRTTVTLAPERDVPNRDLVLDVDFEGAGVQTMSGKGSFAVVVPSRAFGESRQTARRIAILLDRSGSMAGVPIAQARKAIEACLGALGVEDSFGLFAFDNVVETMCSELVSATRENRDQARAFLQRVDARGGTNLALGVLEASKARPTDILILTDGQVAGTDQILACARSAGIRLFCLGIGSASQDRFLSLLARDTGGISRFVTPRERVDLPAVDLFAAMGRPVVSKLKSRDVQPDPPDCVFAGTPVLLFGEGKHVDLNWDGGKLRIDVPEGYPAIGETLRLLRGSRLITDFESRNPAQDLVGWLHQRQERRVSNRLLELSREYGLASRAMALVAVVRREDDRRGEIPETRVVPVGMPQDVQFGAYFGGAGMAAAGAPLAARALLAPDPASLMRRRGSVVAAEASFCFEEEAEAAAGNDGADGSDVLDLAAMLEPDGGMPGETMEIRIVRSIALLLALAEKGHTLARGAFRAHVRRLLDFLNAAKLNDAEAKALQLASSGTPKLGPWLEIAGDDSADWEDLRAGLRL
jgi:Ca-activated chloride channel family protein